MPYCEVCGEPVWDDGAAGEQDYTICWRCEEPTKEDADES